MLRQEIIWQVREMETSFGIDVLYFSSFSRMMSIKRHCSLPSPLAIISGLASH